MSGMVIMMRYIIPTVMLFMLAGTAPGTIWLYTDPTFFNTGTQPQVGSYTPGNISAFEIVNAPYFALLGQGFYTDAIPVKFGNSSNAIQVGSKGTMSQSPVQVTFGGHLEDNLKYAQTKSSLRVGQQGSWSTLSTPGVL
ncbi:MAG: hypothetical protein GYA39_00225 [Methanothrix sp.]|nr:hypothetical protein [Methanothrix sp.]